MHYKKSKTYEISDVFKCNYVALEFFGIYYQKLIEMGDN